MLPSESDWICQTLDGELLRTGCMPRVLYPGSFNPLHHGHRQLAATAERLLQMPVAFELSISNVDKPELESAEVERRLKQFRGHAPIYVTRAATFEQKAKLFPGVTLVVGSDTAQRILSPRYYGDNAGLRDLSLATISSLGCRFLVAARLGPARQLVTLEHLRVPDAHAHLFQAIALEEFRVDISSTELR